MNYPAETELTVSRLLRIGWALGWRTAALGGLVSLMGSWISTRLLASGSMAMVPWVTLLSGLLYVLVSLGVLRSVLNKRFRDFSFRLVKEHWDG